MTKYDQNFIETYTGVKFHFLSPSPDEINIRDIAHSLSLKCRYSGHCKTFYSVGEHSIRVSDILCPDMKLSGLLHDATEAYMPDIPRPIKERFGLRKYEDTIAKVIKEKYGVRNHPIIKLADNILLATEARDLMANMNGWKKLPEPLCSTISPYCPETVEVLFLEHFREFGGKECQTKKKR